MITSFLKEVGQEMEFGSCPLEPQLKQFVKKQEVLRDLVCTAYQSAIQYRQDT